MISVIVPAYNIAPYLERCIKSILNQTYKDFEILLVDDGSTDGTSDICDRLARDDNRIRVFHKQNGGVSSARNVGLNNAKGDYISIIDGDDWIERNLFEDAINALKENYAQVFMFEYFIDKENEVKVHRVASNCYGLINTEEALINTITPNNRFAWSKIFKAHLIEGIYFDEKIILGEDTLFISNIIANSSTTYYSNIPYYHYEQRENSAVRSSFNMRKLSGLEAYKLQLQMCEEKKFRKASVYASAALIELGIALYGRVVESGESNKKEIKMIIKKYIIPEVWKTILSRRVSVKTKMKAIISAFSLDLTCLICAKMSHDVIR